MNPISLTLKLYVYFMKNVFVFINLLPYQCILPCYFIKMLNLVYFLEMVGHADNWVYGGLLNISSMEAILLGKDVIQALRDSGLLPILAFPYSDFYQDLVDSFYMHMKGENGCLSLNGEIHWVSVSFAPHTLVKGFPGLRNEGEAPITEKTYTDGWLLMRGSNSQPNTYDTIADIIDRCLLLNSGGHDKITKAQQ